MRVIALPTLRAFWEGRPAGSDAREPILAWYRHVLQADWAAPAHVKREFATASILRDGRVVFNIGGDRQTYASFVVPAQAGTQCRCSVASERSTKDAGFPPSRE